MGKTFYNFINKNVKVAKSSRYVAHLSLLRYHVQNRNVSTQPHWESYVDGVKLNKNMFYAVQSLVVTVYPVSLPEWDCLATLNQPNVNFRHYIVCIFVLCIRLDHCVIFIFYNNKMYMFKYCYLILCSREFYWVQYDF